MDENCTGTYKMKENAADRFTVRKKEYIIVIGCENGFKEEIIGSMRHVPSARYVSTTQN